MRRSGLSLQRLAYELLPAPISGQIAGATGKHKIETMVILHGILGNKKNLRTLAKEIQKLRPHLQTVIMDHRGHGDSIALSASPAPTENGVEDCAHDLQETLSSSEFIKDVYRHIDSHHAKVPTEYFVPDYLCAHSFGGKVAMQYFKNLFHDSMMASPHKHGHEVKESKTHACGLHEKRNAVYPRDIWILDSSPYQYPPAVLHDPNASSQSVAFVIDILQRAPRFFPHRSAAEKYLAEVAHVPLSLAQWLTSSMIPASTIIPQHQLATSEGGITGKEVSFSLHLPTIQQLFEDFVQRDFDHFLREIAIKSHHDAVVHFVRAEKNHLWEKSGDWKKLSDLVTESRTHHSHHPDKHFRLPIEALEMKNVGHWLHAEQPVQLAKLIHDHSAHPHHNIL